MKNKTDLLPILFLFLVPVFLITGAIIIHFAHKH